MFRPICRLAWIAGVIFLVLSWFDVVGAVAGFVGFWTAAVAVFLWYLPGHSRMARDVPPAVGRDKDLDP
jgi:hypothetical protein